ncbi:MAG: tRNA (adenosine(37)-N6)-threonylcarbamoyltransferase complex ATPase subunit type 1 TsaE [Desulfobacula sp.]|nr:tRNA (adenosine(37)-N6)-threonylcarbamoyltransferase complex ATPase subunit type 1 TsaE [Desulfobacula sp.]
MTSVVSKKIISKKTDDTLTLGKSLGQKMIQKTSIALIGDLGAGKTTFVQGLAKGLGVDKNYYITSPTYTLINTYPADPFTLCHLDLYRLGSVDELEFIGFDDLLEDNHIIIVEWPQILNDISFKFDLEINFEFDDRYNRIISVHASGQAGSNLLSNLLL